MTENTDRPKSHLQAEKDPIWWDWWSESPIEIILIVFILVLFFALPREGCGISQTEDARPPGAAEQTR